MTRRGLLLAVPLLVLGTAPPVSAAPPSAALQFDGRGHGHGVGLAQDSAAALAAAGVSREQILDRFYPHTGRLQRSGDVRVSVWQATPPARGVSVLLPGGGSVLADGRSTFLSPGSTVTVRYDGGRYHLTHVGRPVVAVRSNAGEPTPEPTASPDAAPTDVPDPTATTDPTSAATPSETAATTSEPSPSTSRSPASGRLDSDRPMVLRPAGSSTLSVVATGRSYRGSLAAVHSDGLRLVNTLDVESYLRGLAEVPASWPAAALEATTVAARTYALRAVAAGRSSAFDLCDDSRCQVYRGAAAEQEQTTAAVQATRGEVVEYGGGLAATFYSANAGGLTADAVEGLGASRPLAYLVARVVAPGPVDAWSTRITLADVASALHYPGSLQNLTVSRRGPSGRATELELRGSAGTRRAGAVTAAGALGLPSTLFRVVASTRSATTALRGTALQLPPGAADVSAPPPVLAPLVITPGAVPTPSSDVVAFDPTSSADNGRSGLLLLGLAVGVAAAVLTGASRRRLRAAAPAEIVLEPTPTPAPPVRRNRRGRATPTLWLTVGAATVGAAGALACVKLGDQDSKVLPQLGCQ